jgi:hypothetical protein
LNFFFLLPLSKTAGISSLSTVRAATKPETCAGISTEARKKKEEKKKNSKKFKNSAFSTTESHITPLLEHSTTTFSIRELFWITFSFFQKKVLLSTGSK